MPPRACDVDATSAPSLEQQGAHTLLSTAAATVLGFLLSIVAARALGPGGKGVLDLASATAALFTLVLGGSLNAAITQLVASRRGAPPRLAVQLAGFGILAASVTIACLLPFPRLATSLGLLPADKTQFWALFIAANVGFGIAAAGLRGILIGRNGLIITNRIELAIKAATLGAFVTLALQSARDPAPFALWGLVTTAVLTATLAVASRGPVWAGAGTWRILLATSLPLHATNIVHFLNQRADIFFLQAFHGSEDVGMYALSVSLAQPVLLISSAFAQPLLPQVSLSGSPQEAARMAARACRLFVAIAIVASVLVASAASVLISTIFGAAFDASLPPLLLLLPGMIGFGLANIFTAYLVATGRVGVSLPIALTALVVTSLGNLWWTHAYGALGAAGASTLAYATAGVLFASHFVRQPEAVGAGGLLPRGEDFVAAFALLKQFRL